MLKGWVGLLLQGTWLRPFFGRAMYIVVRGVVGRIAWLIVGFVAAARN